MRYPSKGLRGKVYNGAYMFSSVQFGSFEMISVKMIPVQFSLVRFYSVRFSLVQFGSAQFSSDHLRKKNLSLVWLHMITHGLSITAWFGSIGRLVNQSKIIKYRLDLA